MLDMFTNKILNQNARLDDLIKKASAATPKLDDIVDDGDRVWFCYIDGFDFPEKSNKVQDINFNLAAESEFVARRLFFAARINRQGELFGAENDLPGFFRPFHFAHDGGIADDAQLDCQIEITESYIDDAGQTVVRRFQDQPILVTLTFSHNNVSFGSPSSLHFDIDWEIKRNSVVQCKVTVLTAINNVDVLQSIDTYQIVGVLEGYKKVRAFK